MVVEAGTGNFRNHRVAFVNLRRMWWRRYRLVVLHAKKIAADADGKAMSGTRATCISHDGIMGCCVGHIGAVKLSSALGTARKDLDGQRF